MSETHFNGPLVSGDKQAGVSGGPNTGYVVLTQTAVINQNSTSAVDVTFYVPPNSQLIDIHPDVLTAFNSGTSAVLSVGTASGGTQYASAVDVKTAAGRIAPTFSAAQLAAMDDVGTNTTVVATVTPTGATSAGQVRVTLVYAQKAGV